MSRSSPPSPQVSPSRGGNNKQLGTSRPRRMDKACTLLPGSPFHAAFFGLEDSVRDNFDHEAAAANFCNNRRYARARQNSSSSVLSSSSSMNDSVSSLKQGRPLLPRYGSF